MHSISPRITSFLVKVASRCNLDCSYCYVYHHADQNWRLMPKYLSQENRNAFAERLAEYIQQTGIMHCLVVFHGGEPLLAGAESLATFAAEIRTSTTAKVDFSLQTNGMLLDNSALDIFENANISISLSLDGPRKVNDKYRITRKKRSSFDQTFNALQKLKQYPNIFSGVIAVIDPFTPPDEILAFFAEHQLPNLDFLLPDAHHLRPPLGRDENPDLYVDWLINAFDLWIDHFSHIPLRTFESLLDVISGLPSRTDAFGFGDVSLITIETDGSYHDLDVLKITRDAATKLTGTVKDTPIAFAAASAQINDHRNFLKKQGLCHQCQECSIVDICGGGSLPHRFGSKGFDHPTIYCREMFALVMHVRKRLDELLIQKSDSIKSLEAPSDFDIGEFDYAEHAISFISELCNLAQKTARHEFLRTLDRLDLSDDSAHRYVSEIKNLSSDDLSELTIQPGAIAWRRTMDAHLDGRSMWSVDGAQIHARNSYLGYLLAQLRSGSRLRIGDFDPWLRIPFGNAIRFEDEEIAATAHPLVNDALSIIYAWRPDLGREMRHISRSIQFIRDPLAHPAKIVSFSDNSVPGALFVSVMQENSFIDPYDLADSLLHEHRHQKLYLIEKFHPMTEATSMLVSSPWREDLRPPSGLLHAVFVFVELHRFWLFVQKQGPFYLKNRASVNIHENGKRLNDAFSTLDNCPLTNIGHKLVASLRNSVRLQLGN